MKKILIGTATYNEVSNIEILINKINNLELNLDIIIVDDSSPDGTSKKIKELKTKFSNIILLKRKNKTGLDTAHKIIFKYANHNKYRYLITLDADLSHDPRLIKVFLKRIKNYDTVLGSRYIKGGKNELIGWRFLISKYGNLIIKKILNSKLNEFTTSYRCFDIKKLKNFNLSDVKVKGYSFFMGTLFEINKKGFLIKEIPITFKDRTKGNSKIPRIEILRTIKNLIILSVKKNFTK